MKKRIIITGATGTIGSKLCQKLIALGDEITIFSRNPANAKKKLPGVKKIIQWDYESIDGWKQQLNEVDVVVHLAGANLGAKRWDKDYKKLAYESRIISTRKLIEAIATVDKKPKTFICSSAVGYYGNRSDDYLSEDEEPADNFLAKLCADWEKEAAKVETLGVRCVSIRTGLVLSKDEGLLKQMIPSFKLFFGGYLGNGRQWFPWIHIDDIVGIYLHIINDSAGSGLKGAVNAASPGIVMMKQFSKTLGRVLHRPSFLPIPKFAIKILKGELGNYTTDSQRVVMNKLLNSGYKFKYENLEDALRDLLKK
jgi:uncharacterized protein (TIGR01777 family)